MVKCVSLKLKHIKFSLFPSEHEFPSKEHTKEIAKHTFKLHFLTSHSFLGTFELHVLKRRKRVHTKGVSWS